MKLFAMSFQSSLPRITSALTREIDSASSSSRIACALGGRLFHA